MTTNLNPEFKHIVEAYEDALYMPESDNADLIESIEQDLEEKGTDAIIAGKRTLQDYIQHRLNKVTLAAPAYKDNPEKWVSVIQDFKRRINNLDFEIDLLSGGCQDPDLDHPAMQALQDVINGNPSLSPARLVLTSGVVFTGIEMVKKREYAIEIGAGEDKSIMLYKKDLMTMLAIISNSFPPKSL